MNKLKKHGIYYDSRIKLLLILLTSALAFALGGGLTGLLLFGYWYVRLRISMIGTADAGFDAPFAILDLAIGLSSCAVSDSSMSGILAVSP